MVSEKSLQNGNIVTKHRLEYMFTLGDTTKEEIDD